MKVLFLPQSVYALVWRLTEATSGKAVYEKVRRSRTGSVSRCSATS